MAEESLTSDFILETYFTQTPIEFVGSELYALISEVGEGSRSTAALGAKRRNIEEKEEEVEYNDEDKLVVKEDPTMQHVLKEKRVEKLQLKRENEEDEYGGSDYEVDDLLTWCTTHAIYTRRKRRGCKGPKKERFKVFCKKLNKVFYR